MPIFSCAGFFQTDDRRALEGVLLKTLINKTTKIMKNRGTLWDALRHSCVWGTVIHSILHQHLPAQVRTATFIFPLSRSVRSLWMALTWTLYAHTSERKPTIQCSLKGLLVKAASLITHVQQAESSIIWYLSFTRSFEKLPQSLDVTHGVYQFMADLHFKTEWMTTIKDSAYTFFVFKMQKQLRNIVWIQVFVLVRRQLEKYLYS